MCPNRHSSPPRCHGNTYSFKDPRRLPRALHNSSLSRVPRIRTVYLCSKTRNASLSSARWCRSGHGEANLASSRIPNDQKKEPLIVEATQLSNEDYCSLVAVYFEAVIECAAMAQEEGSNIAPGHRNDVITSPALGVGDYILKCQRSTKQIWLYSPISG
ncbi:uncharacterized protein BDR25DRAFT_386137 [Lindgomyces ingoldianus]|uniref:Uncharacterized protein n=1 Tax=Lindgomyces ingoldianus TaxID=673940 RepID=A0ACB6Q7I9_9PLEO|nr:uncharacterized protein BDR25DRAFT_386137 [Lindgomyces ingoldianus]KAF2462811.1 hypothetical protein BDR25DRAFT_386137 [Lindgomyces ingoldianus]